MAPIRNYAAKVPEELSAANAADWWGEEPERARPQRRRPASARSCRKAGASQARSEKIERAVARVARLARQIADRVWREQLESAHRDPRQLELFDEPNSSSLLRDAVAELLNLMDEGHSLGAIVRRKVALQSLELTAGPPRRELGTNVVRLVPKPMAPFLNYSASALFGNTPKGDELAEAIFQSGLVGLPDLLALRYSELSRLLGNEEYAIECLEVLISAGLGLGSAVPESFKRR